MIPPTPTSRFTDLRRIALTACVSVVVAILQPTWNGLHTILSFPVPNLNWRWVQIPIAALLTAFTALLPLFYFALYKNQSPLRIPKRLRLLALSGALVYSVIVAAKLPEWIKSLIAYWGWIKTLDWSLGATSVLSFVRDSGTIGQLTFALGVVSDVVYVSLLIAIFHQENHPSEARVPISNLLRRVTKITFIAWGLVVSATLFVLLLTPFTFYTLRKAVLQMGRTPPAFGYFFVRQLRTVLQQSCLFVAPYIVHKSQADGLEKSALEPLESGA